MYTYVYHTIVADLVCLAQPEVYVLVVQKGQTEGQSQQVEEIVVAGQNDEHLKQHLGRKITHLCILLHTSLSDFAKHLLLCLLNWRFQSQLVGRIWNSTHLQVKTPEPQSAQWAEEKQRYRDLDDEGRHDAHLLPPHRQLVGKPGQRGGDTLSLIVIRQGCSTHSGKEASFNKLKNKRLICLLSTNKLIANSFDSRRISVSNLKNKNKNKNKLKILWFQRL